MSDNRQRVVVPKTGVLATSDLLGCQTAFMNYARASIYTTATAWPVSGLGIYIPVMLDVPATFYKMTLLNGATVNGTVGVGIYDESFNRLTSVAAATQTGASVTQTFDIADVTVMPGIYFLMACAATTTGTYMAATTTVLSQRTCGVLEQTGITDTPPNPAVPVTFTRTFAPLIAAHYKAVI